MMAWIGIILLFFGNLILPGQQPDSVTSESNGLKASEAIEIAFRNNPGINRLQERIKSQSLNRLLAIGLSSPDLYYFKEGIPEKGAVQNAPGFVEQRYGITQNIQFPLTSIYQYQAQSHLLEALNENLAAQKAMLKADVKKSYTNIALAIKMYQLSVLQVNLAQQIRDAVLTRYQVGESGQIDLLKAEIQLSEANNDLDDANRQLHDARYSLFFLMGLDPDKQTYDIEFSDTLSYFEYDLNQGAVLNTLTMQPEYKSLDRQFMASKSAIRQARSSYLPKIGLSYYKQNYTDGFHFHGFQVNFTVPLWFPFNQHVSTQQAKAYRNEVGWMRQSALLDLKKQAEITWHGYSNSLKTIRRYHEKIQEQSETLLKMTLEGYREGELDLLTLLDTQRTYLASQKRYFQSLHNYYFQLIEIEKYLQTDIVYK